MPTSTVPLEVSKVDVAEAAVFSGRNNRGRFGSDVFMFHVPALSVLHVQSDGTRVQCSLACQRQLTSVKYGEKDAERCA